MVEERWTSYGKVVGDPPTLRSLMPEAQLQASVMHILSPWRAMREEKIQIIAVVQIRVR